MALLILPIYAAVLGLVGGLAGRALGGRKTAPRPGSAAVLAPLLCSGLLLVVLGAKFGHIW